MLKNCGKYVVEENGFGVNIKLDNTIIGSIDNISIDYVDEEVIEELLYGDEDEDEVYADVIL